MLGEAGQAGGREAKGHTGYLACPGCCLSPAHASLVAEIILHELCHGDLRGLVLQARTNGAQVGACEGEA
jgi:hypothetical protein